MNTSRPIPIDHYDDLSVLYEPPSDDELACRFCYL